MTSLLNAAGEPAGETNGSAPWWVTATLKAGVPAAIACGLVYFIAHDVSGNIAALKVDVTGINTRMDQHVIVTERSLKNIERLLGIQCVNAAKNPSDRSTCFAKEY